MKVRITASTHVGEVRDHNEDNFFVCSDLSQNDWSFTNSETIELGHLGSVLIVADGMGGMNAGEVASEIAVEYSRKSFAEKANEVLITSAVAISEFIKETIVGAHYAILTHQQDHPETSGMGTTLIIGWVINDSAYVGWCGDSRGYLYNSNLVESGRADTFAKSGLRVKENLALITKDHSYVQTLIDKGDINHSQAFFHPESNIITQSLGQSERPIDPSTTQVYLNHNDILLLCSDGINAMLEDAEIAEICSQNDDIVGLAQTLITETNQKGGHDNSTLAIIKVDTEGKLVEPMAEPVKNWNQPSSSSKKMKLLISTVGLLVVMVTSFFWMNDGIIPIYGGADSTDVGVDSLSTDILAAPAAPDESAKKDAGEEEFTEEPAATTTTSEPSTRGISEAPSESPVSKAPVEPKNSKEPAQVEDKHDNYPGKYWTIQIALGEDIETTYKNPGLNFLKMWSAISPSDGKRKLYYGCYATKEEAQEVLDEEVKKVIEKAWIPGHHQKPDECKLQNQSNSQDNLNDAKDPNELSIISGSKANSNGSDKQSAVQGTTDDSKDSLNEMGSISTQSPANNKTEDSGGEGSKGPDVRDESNEQLDSIKQDSTLEST